MLLLAAPMLVLVVVYLGALAVLLLSAFWSTDVFTGDIVKSFTLDNFRDVLSSSTLPHRDRAHRAASRWR